jgi:hypothetical protein
MGKGTDRRLTWGCGAEVCVPYCPQASIDRTPDGGGDVESGDVRNHCADL